MAKGFGFFVYWHINLHGLLKVQSPPLEEQLWYYLTNSWVDKWVHAFPKGISTKVIVRMWLWFEHTYYDVAVQYDNNDALGTSPCDLFVIILMYNHPGGNTPQDTNYTATCLPSWKLSKLDKPDM